MSREKGAKSKNSVIIMDQTPHPSTKKKMGRSGHDFYEAINEQIDNALDAFAQNIRIVITQETQKKRASYCILDDGIGMTLQELCDATTIGKSTKTGDPTMVGEYGFGLETSCGRLGNEVFIETHQVGSKEVFTYYRDDKIEREDWNGKFKRKLAKHPSKSYTKITIKSLTEDVSHNSDRPKTLKAKISKKYRRYIENGTKIYVNGTLLTPRVINFSDHVKQIKGELIFKGKKIAYHFGLLTPAQKGESLSYGLELYKYNKLIESDVKNVMGLTGKHGFERDVFGEIQLDDFSTDHTKLKFTRDDEFMQLEQAVKAHPSIKKFYRDVGKYNTNRQQYNPPTKDLQNKLNELTQKIAQQMKKEKLLDSYNFNKPLKASQTQLNGALVPGTSSTPSTTPPVPPTNPPNPNPKPRNPQTLPSTKWMVGGSYINLCPTLADLDAPEIPFVWALTNEINLNITINTGAPLYNNAHKKDVLAVVWIASAFMECLVKEKEVNLDEALAVQKKVIYFGSQEV